MSEVDDDGVPDAVMRDLFAMAALVSMGTWTPSAAPSAYALDAAEAHRLRAVYAYGEADAMMLVRKASRRPGE